MPLAECRLEKTLWFVFSGLRSILIAGVSIRNWDAGAVRAAPRLPLVARDDDPDRLVK
jgi:hypothetical protein